MTSKWAAPSATQTSTPRSLTPRPPPSSHTADLLSRLNLSSTPVPTSVQGHTRSEAIHGPLGTPSEREEAFTYDGRDSVALNGGGGGEGGGRSRTWSSGTEGSGVMVGGSQYSSSGSVLTGRLLSSPVSSPSRPSPLYSKHAPPDYVYASRSFTISPSSSLPRPLRNPSSNHSYPPCSPHIEQPPSGNSIADIRDRVHLYLCQEPHASLPPAVEAGTHALASEKQIPPSPSRASYASDTLTIGGKNSNHHHSPSSSDAGLIEGLRRQLEISRGERSKFAAERIELLTALEAATANAKEEKAARRSVRDEAEKVVSGLNAKVDELRRRLKEQEVQLAVKTCTVDELQERLERAEKQHREAVKELAALEDVDEERRALAQALKHGEDEEKQLRDEQLKNVVVERDLLKLALDDKITELKKSELATDQARNALTASEDQRRHDSATKASAIDALGAAKRLEQVEEEKKKAVAELVAMRSRLEGVQQERDEAMATRTQVESTLATKMRVFRSKWEQATTEHAAEVDKLKQHLAAASAISSSASPPSLSSTLKCRHQGCHPTPPFILELSQSPLVNAAEKAYGEAGVLPSEISSSKDPRWYAQPDLPAKRVAKQLEAERALLTARLDALTRHLHTSELRKEHLEHENLAAAGQIYELERKVEYMYGLLQKLLESTMEREQREGRSQMSNWDSHSDVLSVNDSSTSTSGQSRRA